MADSAGLDFDPHPAGDRLGNLAFNNFKRPGRSGDLRGAHLWHKQVWLLEKLLGESGTRQHERNRQGSSRMKSPLVAFPL
jgi:hypothetical protein